MHGMTISASDVRFDEATMWVALSDGRTIGVPLAWFPRLLATTEARAGWGRIWMGRTRISRRRGWAGRGDRRVA